ncbi:MAG: ATP-grasp domain-containing protein [Planctomycetes bacterium]|nr:ATP-grasp domain-containing protein [Planctomycetota bacterium]
MDILILHDEVEPGARPDETDVLVQRDVVDAALVRAGHRVRAAGAGLDLASLAAGLRAEPPDLVFNLVESVARTGRLIHIVPALLDALGVRFSGAPTDAVYATSNKRLAKRLLRAGGLPTPDAVTTAELVDGAEIAPGSYLVKSVWEHGSVGIGPDSVVDVRDAAELRAALARLEPRFGGDGIAERFIDGREFNLSLLAGPRGPDVLPPAEIEFVDWAPDAPRIVDYRAKWDDGSREYHATPRTFDFRPQDAELLDALCEFALRCWRLFGLRGYARVDFRVDHSGQPWILEVNTNPCLSPDAGFAAAVARAGLSLDEAVARIVADALR